MGNANEWTEIYEFGVMHKEWLLKFLDLKYGIPSITILLKNEVVSLYYSGEIQNITSDETLNKILKRDYYDRILIKMRKKIDIKYINDLKSVARNSFSEISLSDDEDGMVRDFKERCINHTIEKLKDILGNYNNIKVYQYPGKQVVEEALKLFNSISNIRDVLEVFEEVSN